MKKNRKKRTIEEVIDSFKKYNDNENLLKRIDDAYNFVIDIYDNDTLSHALSVTYILTTVFSDIDTVVAGLLHSIDIDEYRSDVEELFGNDVIKLIYGVSKISKINFSCENDYLIEYYKKIIVGMSEDVRVIIIKLADRLDTMRNLFVHPEEIQKKKAKETIEIFAPIAHHLGINKIKGELEDLSLRYLKPDVFYDIAEKLNKTKEDRDLTVNEMLESVSNLLTEHNIKHELKGRSKSIYSIYKKLDKGKKFSDIYDLLALRVFVDTEQDCYLALGIIHSKFKPYPKRFKDYVAMPKSNMYQSLHTTVFGVDGHLFEIQIRTYEMDEIAENGIASHWAYKENKDASIQNITEQKLQFFKSIIELNEEKLSSEDFVNSVKDEVLNNNIYCFTPKGDVFELPNGATPIDFAYKVHTRVGETMVGAIVNNQMVPLDYHLKDNDIVKINTNKNSPGPSKEWLNIVKSTQTKNKIRAFFTKSEREIYIERGKDSLEKELRKRKISFSEFFTDENLNRITSELKVENLDDLYLHVGNGKYTSNGVVNIIYKKEEEELSFKKINFKNNDNDIIVDGIDKIKVNIASCCNPIPGDEIIGFITKASGITVHRCNCRNVIEAERLVSVKFNDVTKDRYMSTILIYTNTNENKLMDIVKKFSGFDCVIDNFSTINKNYTNIYELDLYVKNLEQLLNIARELERFEFVTKVERLNR